MTNSAQTSIRISVIIPVYNHADYLTACLNALARQTISHDQFEVVVIDNGSDEPPEALVAMHSFARFAEESRPGSFAARNTGIKLARGAILAFTDADCLPHSDWLESALAVIEGDDSIDVVAGRIDVVASDPSHPNATELFDIAIRLDQQKRVAASYGVVTANLVTRREMFDHVGPFDDSLMSGADAVWSARAAECGYTVKYVDEVVVVHPARTKISEVLRQARRRAGGTIDMYARKSPRSLMAKVATAAKRLLPRFAGLADARRKLLKRGYGWWAWVRVVWVMQLVHYASTVEIVWRWCGAPAERR